MRFAPAGILAAAAALAVAGCDSARDVEQRSEASACARCHGFPPAAPHPQQALVCNACHSTTVSEGTQLVPGGTHMNGDVDVVAHPDFYPAHPVQALQDLGTCQNCHGASFDVVWNGQSCNSCHGLLTFPDWQTNCTFCHGRRTTGWTAAQLPLAAPPEAVEDGVEATSDRRVGAHQRHLLGGAFSNPIACTECHPGPAGLAHVNRQVQLAWGPLASADGAAAEWTGTTCANYCHGATLPQSTPPREPIAWTSSAGLGCGSCHEANPTTGRHPGIGATAHAGFECRACHGGTYGRTAADKALHVSGALNLDPLVGWNATLRSCTTTCHVNPGTARPW